MRGFDPLPRRVTHFPQTRRGHGAISVVQVHNGDTVRSPAPCVDPTCQLNQPKSKNVHVDPEANLKDWCEEHRVSLKYLDPSTAMVRATGGR